MSVTVTRGREASDVGCTGKHLDGRQWHDNAEVGLRLCREMGRDLLRPPVPCIHA